MIEQTKHVDETITGVNPLLADMPTVTSNGVTYTLRRLGIADVFRMVRIMGLGSKVAGIDIMTELTNTDDIAGTLAVQLCTILPFAERQISEMLADVLCVTPEQFADPDVFPMESIVDVVQAVAAHPDLTSFFTRLSQLLGMMLPGAEAATPEVTPSESMMPSA